MGQAKPRTETLLQELIAVAKKLNIEVRTEKLLREVGYRARSGRCRVKGRDLIIIDRDSPVAEQVDFLTAEMGKQESDPAFLPPQPGARSKR